MNNKNIKKIILTGGSHAGKTTLIKFLETEGHKVVHESAIDVIQDISSDFKSMSDFQNWRESNLPLFQEQIAERHMINERQAISSLAGDDRKLLFLDRSPLDCLAYLAVPQSSPTEMTSTIASAYEYDQVFVLDTIQVGFDQRGQTGRHSNYNGSIEIRDKLVELYGEISPEKVTILPATSTEERARMIFEKLA